MGIGNLLGMPSKFAGGGNLFGLGGNKAVAGKNLSSGNPKVIRQTSHFTSGGSEYRAVRQRIKKLGVVNALVKAADGKIIHEKLKDKELFDHIKRAVGTSGMTNEAWQRRLNEKKGFTSIDSKGNKKTYIISGAEIKKRQALGRIFHPDGPTREEIALKEKHDEKIKRINVLETQIGREREDKSKITYLKNRRQGKNAIDFRSGDRKIGAADIGVQGQKYVVSMQGGGGTANTGFANKIENPEAENKQGTIADLGKPKDVKGITEEKNVPMFRK